MKKLPKGTYCCDMRRFRHRGVHFIPNGPVYAVGDSTRLQFNPIEEEDVVPLTARLFVGLSVGQRATYTVDDVVKITKRVRQQQGQSPDSSFLLQKGIYTDKANEIVEEDSVQIVIFSFDESDKKEFQRQMGELAQVLAEELDQETIYVELQERGVPYRILKVTR
jgi:hypothetical protein